MKLDVPVVSLMMQNIDLKEKCFYLCEGIDDDSPKKVFLALTALKTVQDARPIRMYLSSVGGDVEAGLAIYDLLREVPNLEIIVVGYAYSMGIIILQAAKRRIMRPNASLMAHWGHQAIEDNNPVNYDKKLEFQKVLDTKCDTILLERMKKKRKSMTLNKVKKLTQFDWYMSPDEAIKVGLADCVENA